MQWKRREMERSKSYGRHPGFLDSLSVTRASLGMDRCRAVRGEARRVMLLVLRSSPWEAVTLEGALGPRWLARP